MYLLLIARSGSLLCTTRRSQITWNPAKGKSYLHNLHVFLHILLQVSLLHAFWICLHCSHCSYSKSCRNIKHIWNMDLKAFGRRISLRLLVWLFVSIINAIKAGLIHRGWDLLVTMMTYSDNRIMIIKMSCMSTICQFQCCQHSAKVQTAEQPPSIATPCHISKPRKKTIQNKFKNTHVSGFVVTSVRMSSLHLLCHPCQSMLLAVAWHQLVSVCHYWPNLASWQVRSKITRTPMKHLPQQSENKSRP